ncbi:3-methyl-2-oxobutanoate hydroxymethyltransferase, partial [Pseudomonas sp. FW305-47B]|uniref:3-methyl-2-oxobutanoate hydroxymethyltransferase n=1 Tax=Pseudomonas sp. FW305-47B TaxID=2070558 RepID=UPI000CB86989
ECDGQIQVIYDVLGLADTVYKHAREFVDGRSMVTDGISRYADGVRAGTFPDASNSF